MKYFISIYIINYNKKINDKLFILYFITNLNLAE